MGASLKPKKCQLLRPRAADLLEQRAWEWSWSCILGDDVLFWYYLHGTAVKPRCLKMLSHTFTLDYQNVSYLYQLQVTWELTGILVRIHPRMCFSLADRLSENYLEEISKAATVTHKTGNFAEGDWSWERYDEHLWANRRLLVPWPAVQLWKERQHLDFHNKEKKYKPITASFLCLMIMLVSSKVGIPQE